MKIIKRIILCLLLLITATGCSKEAIELEDVRFKINDKWIEKGMTLQDFKDDGWVINKKIKNDADPKYKRYLLQQKEEDALNVIVYFKKSEKQGPWDILYVKNFLNEDQVSLYLPKGISKDSTVKDMIQAYGEPNSNTASILTYQDLNGTQWLFNLYDNQLVDISIRMGEDKKLNFNTEKNIGHKVYVSLLHPIKGKHPNAISNEDMYIDDMRVSDSTTLQDFLNNGWTTDSTLNISLVEAHKNNVTIRLFYLNDGTLEQHMSEKIRSIQVEGDAKQKLIFPYNINANANIAAIINEFGTPIDVSNYENGGIYAYYGKNKQIDLIYEDK